MDDAILVPAALIFLLAAPASSQTVLGSWATGGPFAGGLDYDPATDTVWVVDSTADLIQQFDRAGVLLQSWPASAPPGSGLTSAQPIGCAVDPATGNVWVGDEGEWCYELDPTGTWTGRSFSTKPSLGDVSGAAWDPINGTLWVSQDSSPQLAVEFDTNGVVQQSVSLAGAGSVDPDGFGFHSVTRHLFLGEDTGDKLIETDATGALVNSWALAGLGISPEGLGLDEGNGVMFVADGFGGTVWELGGILSSADLTGSPGQVSIAGGGVQTLYLNADLAHAGSTYLLLGTELGTTPGVPVDGLVLPLNIGIYLLHTLSNPNQAPLSNSLGTLDALGQATATFTLPALTLNPAFAGASLHHAYALFQVVPTVKVVYASEAVEVLLVP